MRAMMQKAEDFCFMFKGTTIKNVGADLRRILPPKMQQSRKSITSVSAWVLVNPRCSEVDNQY